MTKPKHKYSIIFLSFILPFFSIYFINSSFFKLKEIKLEGLNPYLEKEINPFLEKLKGKNLLFLNSKDLDLENFSFLDVEIFQKVLPDKLFIKFNIKEELGTYISVYGSFDLYKGGFLFPRFKEGDEKFIIEGTISKEKLKYISDLLENNGFLYEYFYGIKIEEDNSFKLLNKKGHWIEINENKDINYLKLLSRISEKCPQIIEKEKLSMINFNLFIVNSKEGK